MKNKIIKSTVLSCLGIISYIISLDILWNMLNEYYPTRKNLFLGLAYYYSKWIFSIIIILSVYIWLIIKNKGQRLLVISLLFIIYPLYWSSSLLVYPYRVSLLIAFSILFYISLHICVSNNQKN